MSNITGGSAFPAGKPENAAAPSGGQAGVESTHAQREIFSASLTDPAASLGYNHSISIRFDGALDVDAIYSAMVNLIDRHEALRGYFSADGMRFFIREGSDLEMPLMDLSAQTEPQASASYEMVLDRELGHLFDLTNGPLFRTVLVKYSATRWTLILNCHHAVVDGWSLKTILDDLPKLYNALVTDQECADLDDPSSFVEHLALACRRERETALRVREYWREVYAGGVPILDLPLDHPRPLVRTYASARIDYLLDRDVYRRLVDHGAAIGVSQFATLLSAFGLYLHRISGQSDIVIGVPAAGQITAGKSKLLGHDARVMPIRCVLREEDNFAAYALRTMNTFLAAYENQWISIPELLSTLNPPTDNSRAPFVSVLFNFDPGMKYEDFTFNGLDARHVFNPRKADTFEISVNAVVDGPDMLLEWVYNTDLFDAAQMRLRLEQFHLLMRSIGERPSEPARLLAMVPADQIDSMDRSLNSTEMHYDRALCVDELVARTVEAYPKKVAIEFGAASTTYEQLWTQSGRVAASIIGMDLARGPLIGVMLDRSEAMIAVLLGIWRAGGAFVPLDPAYPLDRLQYMVDNSQIRVVLTLGVAADAPPIRGVQLVDVGPILENPDLNQVPARDRSSEDRAYVIYTSGSSGRPKGVQIPHRALNNFLHSMRTQSPGLGPDDRMLAVTTISFDISALEIWLPLVTGATVVLVDRNTAVDGQALASVIDDHRVNFVQATPATWRLLVYAGWQGSPRVTALCGGEALSRDMADDLMARVGTLWNLYGPTEATVWSTIDRVGPGLVTIGRPIGNTQAYVLDAAGQWVPRGTIGELWLGGDGVALGYLGREDLTHERFVPNPFTGRGRMYRTGDLVRLSPDGRIEYLGRNDFQVKVRGYRIELGEVQHALSEHPAIQQCVVAVRERTPGDAHLVAYFRTHAGQRPPASELRNELRKRLPEYMVPGFFVAVASFPLTLNGKIDNNALPDPFVRAEKTEASSPERHSDIARAEAILGEHADIDQAILVLAAGQPVGARPIAFLVPRRGQEPGVIQVRKQLRSKVPEAMIPDTVLLIGEPPLTPDGRIDRRALLASAGMEESRRAARDGASEPHTDAERLLAEAWGSLLGINDVGVNDNFFQLGGNSLQSIQMILRVQERTGYRMNPRVVITNSLGQLAHELSSATLAKTIK